VGRVEKVVGDDEKTLLDGILRYISEDRRSGSGFRHVSSWARVRRAETKGV
jgi:hypothetical protein